MQFKITTVGQNDQLRDLCQDHINSLWVPDHLTPAQAEEFALDHFKRCLNGEVEMLRVDAVKGTM